MGDNEFHPYEPRDAGQYGAGKSGAGKSGAGKSGPSTPRSGLKTWEKWAIGGTVLTIAVAVTLMILTRASADVVASSSPSPSASGAPSASPSPPPTVTIDVNGRALPGFVTVDPSLPDALPLPAQIWNQTTAGWVLATYRPSVSVWDDSTQVQSDDATKQVIYLVSPEGVRYQVLELDAKKSIGIESWSAGSDHAIVRENTQWTDQGRALSLDLRTGDITEYKTPFSEGSVFLTLSDGARVWYAHTGLQDSMKTGDTYLERNGEFTLIGGNWGVEFAAPFRPSPNGTYLPLFRDGDGNGNRVWDIAFLKLSDGSVTHAVPLAGVVAFLPGAWENDTTLQVQEYDYETQTTQHFVVDATTGVMTKAAVEQVFPRVQHEFWVGEGSWAGAYMSSESDFNSYQGQVGIESGKSLSEIPFVDASGTRYGFAQIKAVVGGKIYAELLTHSQDYPEPYTIVTYDISKGRQLVLIPVPPAGSTVNATTSTPYDRVTGASSWVVSS